MDVLTTRRFMFSAAHRYWRDDWTVERNQAVFGKCTNEHGHGHNYTLYVTVAGPVDADTGMVINVTELKRIVNRLLEQFDHRHLNHDTPYFKDRIPTTENIVQVLWQLIAPQLPESIRLYRLRLYETEDLYAEYMGATETFFSRSYQFSAAHRLHAPNLSDAENLEMYGKCNNVHGHGHNYTLEVTIGGLVDAATGMVINLVDLDAGVHSVLEHFDHRHLDLQVPEFQERPSTGENIVLVLWDRLQQVFGSQLHHLRLWETSNNIFEYPAHV